MKLTIEGSSSDIRGVLVDSNAIYNEARERLGNEQLRREYDALQTELSKTRGELSEVRLNLKASQQLMSSEVRRASAATDTAASVKNEVSMMSAKLAERDAVIQRLQYDLKNKVSDPIILSAMQEAEVEALYQDLVREMGIKPLTFKLPHQDAGTITAEHLLSTVFNCLAQGNKVGALKEIRVATNLSIYRVRDMLDDALLAFGSLTNENGKPIPKNPIKSTVIKK